MARVPSYISRIDEALRAEEGRGDLLDQADEFREQGGAGWALIADGYGVVRASTRDRERFGDTLGGALIEEALAADGAEGVWVEPTEAGDSIYLAASVPLVAPGAAPSGVLILGLAIDQEFAERLKRHTASEVYFATFDTLGTPVVVAATISPDTLNHVLAGQYPGDGREITEVPARVRISAAGSTWIGAAGPLLTASGTIVGEYAGLRARETELAPFDALRRSVLYAFAGGLGVALMVSLLLARQIVGPIRRLVAVTRDIAEGRYEGSVEIGSRDEIGELARAFDVMRAELQEQRRLAGFLGSSAATVKTQLIGAPPTGIGVGGVLAGRYEIKSQLGEGGMGVVYRAYDRELGEPVAIKTLRAELLGDASQLERFKQEIRLARRITHPNVVRTHDLGEADGLYFITMEFVEGTSLDQLIGRKGALPLDVTLTIGRQLCRALEVAHAQGVVHRDIKPQNLVVDPQGFLKVMDFGIARLVEGRQGQPGTGLTAAGSIIGTPEYMAPEQLMGQAVDGRADLYAAGVVLYECATGRRLFTGESFATVLMKQVQEAPPDPRATVPGLPESFSRVVLRALAKPPAERWQTASEFLHQLDLIRI
ncbi:MAG: protein kinase [Gemmatimonadota bacterium]|nr:protein kinase [Gemmatimonadota bacterium]